MKVCKSKKMNAILRWCVCLLAVCFVMQPISIMAKSSKRVIRYNGKDYVYTKSQVNVTVNDKTVKTPFGGIILNNISMLPAYDTFYQSELGTYYEYDEISNELTLETVDTAVRLPINKKYMYVDGKKKTISQATIKVYDKNMKKTRLMVSGRDVSNALGFQYEWNNSKVTSALYTEEYLDSKEDEVDTDTPEEDNSDNENPDDTQTEEPDNDQSNDTEQPDNTTSDEEDETDAVSIPKNYALKIPKPENMDMDSYEIDDNYWQKEFTITFDDDYSEFYEENSIIKKKSNVSNISVSQDKNDCTQVVLKTKKIQGFRITETKDALYVEVDTPQKIYDKIVVIDPGHGGSDPGTQGNGIVEKDKTLEIAKRVKEYFDGEEEYKIYFTRLADSVSGMTAGSSGVKDSRMSLPARYNFANEIDADLFISIHLNSFGSSPNGTETYYSAKNTSKNDWGITSKELATRMQKAIQSVINRQNRGVKVNSNLAVLTHTNMPAILIETAFVSNKTDASILKNPDKIDEVANAIYDVIVGTFE